MQIQLLTRRFFCTNQTCVRRIFCERLPRVVAAYGRQTVRLNDTLRLIGMMLGGQAGAFLAAGLGMLISGVEIVTRDRSKAYESGIRQGAPAAVQVADRFHLLQNLAETLDQAFGAHSQTLKAIAAGSSLSSVTSPDRTAVVPVLPPTPSTKEQRRAEQRRARRLANYQQVWTLHHQGWSAPAIARQLGIGRNTVLKYLHTFTFPERQGRSDCGRSLLDPYKDYLIQRWNDGCCEVLQLFREIQGRGYSGSYDTVSRYARRFRQAQGTQQRKQHSVKLLPKVRESQKRFLTPRRAAHLVLQRQELREPDDEQLVQLMAQHPDLTEAIELTQSFTQLVRTQEPEQLDPWLEQALHSQLSPFHRFAKRLLEDYEAVKAGVTLPWSNGQTCWAD